MPEDLTDAAHTLREDPTADAAHAASTYLTLGLATAQAYLRHAAADADARAAQLHQLAEEPGPTTGRQGWERYAAAVREVLPADVADHVVGDRAWPQLARALDRVQAAGGQPLALLGEVAGQRELASAHSGAEVLAYRLARRDGLAQPSPGEVAARSFGDPPPRRSEVDAAALTAGAGLDREAQMLAAAARQVAATVDDVTTHRVDEHAEGVKDSLPLTDQARGVAAAAAHFARPLTSVPASGATTPASPTAEGPAAAATQRAAAQPFRH